MIERKGNPSCSVKLDGGRRLCACESTKEDNGREDEWESHRLKASCSMITFILAEATVREVVAMRRPLVICLLAVLGLLATSSPIPAPSSPTPGWATVTNGLTSTADGCEGNARVEYTLLPTDLEGGIYLDVQPGCGVNVYFVDPSDPEVLSAAGAMVVRSIYSPLWVESTVVFSGTNLVCPTTGGDAAGSYGGSDNEPQLTPRFTPYPQMWSTYCSIGHEQIWDIDDPWCVSYPPCYFHGVAGASGGATPVCDFYVVWHGSRENAPHGCGWSESNLVWLEEPDLVDLRDYIPPGTTRSFER